MCECADDCQVKKKSYKSVQGVQLIVNITPIYVKCGSSASQFGRPLVIMQHNANGFFSECHTMMASNSFRMAGDSLTPQSACSSGVPHKMRRRPLVVVITDSRKSRSDSIQPLRKSDLHLNCPVYHFRPISHSLDIRTLTKEWSQFPGVHDGRCGEQTSC